MLSHILNGPRSRLLALRFVLSVHPVCRRGCLRVEVLAELGFILGHEGAVTPIQDPANLPDQVPTASHGDSSGRLAQLPDLFFGQTPTKAGHRMDAEPHRGQQQRLDPAGTKQQVRTNQVSVNGSGAIGDEPLVLSDLEYQLTSARPEDGRVLGDRLVRPRFRDSQKGLHRSTRTSTHTQQSLRGKGSWGTSACHFPLANTNSTALTSGTAQEVTFGIFDIGTVVVRCGAFGSSISATETERCPTRGNLAPLRFPQAQLAALEGSILPVVRRGKTGLVLLRNRLPQGRR